MRVLFFAQVSHIALTSPAIDLLNKYNETTRLDNVKLLTKGRGLLIGRYSFNN